MEGVSSGGKGGFEFINLSSVAKAVGTSEPAVRFLIALIIGKSFMYDFVYFPYSVLKILPQVTSDAVVHCLLFFKKSFSFHFNFFIHGGPINQGLLLFRGPWKKT